MRRLFAVLATLGAAMLLFIPGALAAESEPDGNETEEEVKDGGADEEEKKEETDDEEGRKKPRKPAKPEIKCHGAKGFGAEPKVECSWTGPEGDYTYKLIRKGGGERKVVYMDEGTEHTDKDVKYGTRYRYRVVVLEDGERVRRSRWNKAIERRGKIERLPFACEVMEGDEPTTPEGELDKEPLGLEGDADENVTEEDSVDKPEAHMVGCTWEATSKKSAVAYEVWRKVRGERRKMVDVVSLEEDLHFEEELPADTAKVKYVVRAVDMDGRRVGHSKIEWIRFDR